MQFSGSLNERKKKPDARKDHQVNYVISVVLTFFYNSPCQGYCLKIADKS